MVDWSEIGPWEPCADLGQIFISDVKPDVRRAHEHALVQHYWTTLVENGVDANQFTFAQCWDSYQRASIERWLMLLVVLCVFPLPPAAYKYFHDQVWAFVNDHLGSREHLALKAVVRVIMPY